MDMLNAFAPAILGFGAGGALMQLFLGVENNPVWFGFCVLLFVIGLVLVLS